MLPLPFPFFPPQFLHSQTSAFLPSSSAVNSNIAPAAEGARLTTEMAGEFEELTELKLGLKDKIVEIGGDEDLDEFESDEVEETRSINLTRDV